MWIKLQPVDTDWHQMQHAPNLVYEAIGANSTA
jgi:hypothetical protein